MKEWSPRVEHSRTPWHGPKSRARQLLGVEPRVQPVGDRLFLSALEREFGADATGVQGVRFIDFVHAKDGFRYTIALCWTNSDPVIRGALFTEAADIVAATGWYPLLAGERLSSPHWAKSTVPPTPPIEIDGPRSMVAIEPACPADQGTAVRVRFDHGSVLLDAGFGPGLVVQPTDLAVLVSHGHRDHAGGVLDGYTAELPTVMTRTTYLLLDRKLQVGGKLRLIDPGSSFQIGDVAVTAVSVPHVPGSVGYLLDDGERAVLYTGDIVLRSGRHSADGHILKLLPPDRQTTVILDATMAGRAGGASNHDAATSVLALGPADVVLVGAPDQLTYAFADMFFVSKQPLFRGEISYMLSSTIRHVAMTMHEAAIRRDWAAIDPLLHAQYAKSMSAWAESCWLYWLDRTRNVPPGRRVWLLDPNCTTDKFAPHDHAVRLSIGRGSDIEAQGVDTTPWTAHSNESTLAEFVRELERRGIRVVLFHNFPRRLDKFAKAEGLDATPLRVGIQAFGSSAAQRSR